VAQGFAGALITPQITGFIQQLFQDEARGRAFGLFGATVGISTAIGPLLGGALIALFGPDHGWRAVFFVNLPIGAVILVLAQRLLPAPEPHRQRAHHTLDPLGVVLLAAAVVFVLIALIERRTWDSPTRLLLYPAAAILLAAFAVHERRYARTGQPMVDPRLFEIRPYVLGLSIALIYFAGFTATFFIYTQYVQVGLHYTALESGLATMPFAIGSALMASLGGRHALRRGRTLVAVGLVTVLVGFALIYLAVSIVPGAGVGLAAAIPLLIAGLGSGLVIAPNQTLTLNEVPVRQAGSAGGVLQTGQQVGAAAGVAVTGSVFYSTVAATHGDFAIGFRHGVIAIGAFVTAALLLAIYDIVTAARR
jgi:MFS family permease